MGIEDESEKLDRTAKMLEKHLNGWVVSGHLEDDSEVIALGNMVIELLGPWMDWPERIASEWTITLTGKA